MRELSRPQWLLRLIVVAATVVALVAIGRPGHGAAPFWLAIGFGLAVLFALQPDSMVGAFTLGYVVILAAFHVRHDVQPSALLVAAGVITAHIAAGLTAYTPERAGPDPHLVATWTRRGALTLLPSVLAWLVARATHDSGPAWWAAGTVIVLAGAVAVTVAVRRAAPPQP